MKYYIMSGDIAIATFNTDNFEAEIIDYKRCPLYLKKNNSVLKWIEGRVIDGSRHNSRSLKRAFGLSSYAEPFETVLTMDAAVITDNYWIKKDGTNKLYSEIKFNKNDYFKMAIDKDIYSETLKRTRTPELTNIGSKEKGWLLEGDAWWLYKNESFEEVYSEYITYKIGQQLGYDMAEYTIHDEGKYIKSKDFTAGLFNLHHANSILADHEENGKKIIEEDYVYNYDTFYRINPQIAKQYVEIITLDAICHNVDRHTENYGLLTDCITGEIVSLAPNYDNNETLGTYTDINKTQHNDKLILDLISLAKERNLILEIPYMDARIVNSILIEVEEKLPYPKEIISKFICDRYERLTEEDSFKVIKKTPYQKLHKQSIKL